MSIEACSNCRFLYENDHGIKTGFSDPAYRATYHCRRFPPSAPFVPVDGSRHVTRALEISWPRIELSWWCGEFAARER